jgi:hypothetical protein
MPIEKYRSGEEMNAAPTVVPEDEGFDRWVRLCARYRRIAPLVFPRGVFMFASLAEAQEARAAVTAENARRLRGGRRLEDE